MNKYLVDCGVASRRKCDELIAAGSVSINGEVVRSPGSRVNTESDEVRLHNKPVRPLKSYEYILLNKPKDVITTMSDERGRRTVLDFIKSRNRVFPVGRLDRDTTGVLLLTNDGDLAYRLMHPKFKVQKTYEVMLNAPLKRSDQLKLEQGVELEEGITSECTVMLDPVDQKFVQMTLHQGWKRQIKRMFEALGYRVVNLKRVKFGFLDARGLKRGQWRFLTGSEIERLKRL